MTINKLGKMFYIIFNDLFWVSWISFVLFYLIEIKIPGLISDYLNPNLLLSVVLLSAVASSFLHEEKEK